MLRKVDIRARVQELDARLRTKHETSTQQLDERSRLIEACRVAGDHVIEPVLLGLWELGMACSFCGHRPSASAAEISRHLVIG